MTSGTAPVARDTRIRWLLVIAAALAVLALLMLLGWTHLLMPSYKTPGKDQPLGDLIDAIDRVEGPATAAFAAVSGLGALAGGAMTAGGMPQGMRIMTASGLAFGGVMLTKGLIA